MFSPKDNKKEKVINTDLVETIIGFNSTVEGLVKTQGSVRVDGKLIGDVETQGNLIVGEKGSLKGNVKAKTVTIAGEILGNISADEKIELNKTARLLGDIISKFVVIEDGAEFSGNCKMDRKENQQNLLGQPAKVGQPAKANK